MEFRYMVEDDWNTFSAVETVIFEGDELGKEDYKRILNNKGFIGLFEDDEYIGYVYMRPYESYCHLSRIGVNPQYQGKGYGTKLIEFALKWYKQHECQRVGLYVDTKNKAAIALYKNHGFDVHFESWHYIIKEKKFVHGQNTTNFDLQELNLEHLDFICSTFPKINRERLHSWMTEQKTSERKLHFLGMFDKEDLVAFARFSPAYSGCMPFVYQKISHVDPFIQMMFETYVLEDKDYLRLTFDQHKELAELFEKRAYEQHHHLFHMVRQIK